MNHGIYGEYNIEVLRSGSNESYYPFGAGYQKNLILDDFFTKILSGWNHSSQAWMQTCITNTGTGISTRFDTTGTFQYVNGQPFNDRTWASTVFSTVFNQSENKMTMSRDFTFDPVTGSPRTYREAMVGLFYETSSNQATNIESDIALSHFVFPQDVVVNVGDRLRINYTLNLIIDYLSPTGTPISLSGNGYNFDGRVLMRTNDIGIFGYNADSSYTFFTLNSPASSISANQIYKLVNSNANSYTLQNSTSYPARFTLFGTQSYNGVGFFGQGFATGIYPFKYAGATISGSAATISRSNFNIDDNGASIEMNYYFPPSATQRSNISGIVLTRYADAGEGNINFGGVYLLFNQPQNILANEPISMKLNWSVRRI